MHPDEDFSQQPSKLQGHIPLGSFTASTSELNLWKAITQHPDFHRLLSTHKEDSNLA